MATTGKPVSIDRGRKSVKTVLIKAACELLADVGPNAMSVRTVAQRAGVNHGQVHHYFGGKQGLIDAAMHHLAAEHFKNAHERAKGDIVPKPLTLGEDAQYLRAIVRLALDGDVATATREIEEGISIPDEIRRFLAATYPDNQVPLDAKARLAMTFAMELGWSALESYILHIADIQDDEVEAVREHARVLSRHFIEELVAPQAEPT